MLRHQCMAVQCSFFHCDRPTLLGFVCVMFFSPAGFASTAIMAVSLLHIKAPCSSNGKPVPGGVVSPNSGMCVGTFHGTGK